MPKVVISEELRNQLRGAAGDTVELVDAAGEPVGRVTRYTNVGGYWIEGDLPTDAEVDEAARSGRTRTSAEVLTMLRKLTEAME